MTLVKLSKEALALPFFGGLAVVAGCAEDLEAVWMAEQPLQVAGFQHRADAFLVVDCYLFRSSERFALGTDVEAS